MGFKRFCTKFLIEDHEEFKWIKPEEYKEHDLIQNLHLEFEAFLKSS